MNLFKPIIMWLFLSALNNPSFASVELTCQRQNKNFAKALKIFHTLDNAIDQYNEILERYTLRLTVILDLIYEEEESIPYESELTQIIAVIMAPLSEASRQLKPLMNRTQYKNLRTNISKLKTHFHNALSNRVFQRKNEESEFISAYSTSLINALIVKPEERDLAFKSILGKKNFACIENLDRIIQSFFPERDRDTRAFSVFRTNVRVSLELDGIFPDKELFQEINSYALKRTQMLRSREQKLRQDHDFKYFLAATRP